MAERVWSEKDLVRRANRRLAVLRHAEEVSGNVAATCRYFGISRNIFYRWKRRWEDEGLDGLKDWSSAPLHCPTITHPEVVEKIIHLRQHYHGHDELLALVEHARVPSFPIRSRHEPPTGAAPRVLGQVTWPLVVAVAGRQHDSRRAAVSVARTGRTADPEASLLSTT